QCAASRVPLAYLPSSASVEKSDSMSTFMSRRKMPWVDAYAISIALVIDIVNTIVFREQSSTDAR
ncbi:hypothetical protein, partial [Robbsia andropogonis]|uniref:hypothetical protein n=1 Tax=Robbsia andropogonis TaxID=28092 RepID=UPI001ABA7C72